ncbi:hypothetical protein BKA62DRAFT_756327 [Auriculariales sp. MPI-PUGE-AT-0066]|nr:hypothetical protein BKA62DRAFT_756327 [Auriculariales sp. MPI-PUGE-AT-0066]
MSSDIAELQRKMHWSTVTLEPYAPPQHAIPVDLRNGGRFPSLGLTGLPPTSCREHPVFIGLAPYMGGLVPCKVLPDDSCAAFSHTHKELTIQGPFFVVPLNQSTMEWVNTSHGKIPTDVDLWKPALRIPASPFTTPSGLSTVFEYLVRQASTSSRELISHTWVARNSACTT